MSLSVLICYDTNTAYLEHSRNVINTKRKFSFPVLKSRYNVTAVRLDACLAWSCGLARLRHRFRPNLEVKMSIIVKVNILSMGIVKCLNFACDKTIWQRHGCVVTAAHALGWPGSVTCNLHAPRVGTELITSAWYHSLLIMKLNLVRCSLPI